MVILSSVFNLNKVKINLLLSILFLLPLLQSCDPADNEYKKGLKADKPEQKILHFTKAIEQKPKLLMAYFHRGNVYAFKGDFEKAVADYTKSLDIKDRFTAARFNRARSYQEMKKTDLAIIDYKKVVEYDPESPFPHLFLGYIFTKRNAKKTACHHFNQACALENNEGCSQKESLQCD